MGSSRSVDGGAKVKQVKHSCYCCGRKKCNKIKGLGALKQKQKQLMFHSRQIEVEREGVAQKGRDPPARSSKPREGPKARAYNQPKKAPSRGLKIGQKGPSLRPLWHTQWSLPGTAAA